MNRTFTIAAVSGLVAGLSACGSGTPAPTDPATTAPTADPAAKHNCGAKAGEKHVCSAAHKDEAPTADAPKADAPKADAPKADAPKPDAPK